MSASAVYLVVAAMGAVLAVIGMAVFLKRHFSPSQPGVAVEPPQRVRVPPTPLQQRALWGLVITIVTSCVVAAILIVGDASRYDEDRGMRLLVYGVVLAGALAYVILLVRTRLRRGPGEIAMDERDRMIVARAPAVQLIAVLCSVAIWSIALTEAYWDRGAIPIFYPNLMFWTIYAVSILAWSVGVLVGYRRL